RRRQAPGAAERHSRHPGAHSVRERQAQARPPRSTRSARIQRDPARLGVGGPLRGPARMRWLTALLVLAIELWLGARQAAAVARHRERVPGPFAASVSPAEHAKAADYTLARLRLGRLGSLIDAALTLALTVGGGIAAVDALWRHGRLTEPWLGLAVIASVALLVELIHLPLSVWRTFGLEARFGFNRTTPALFLADLGRGLALAVALGAPVLAAILLLMERAVRWWWVWAWGLWLAVMLLMTWAWPAFIAPLFNRFVPLQDLALRARIEALLDR